MVYKVKKIQTIQERRPEPSGRMPRIDEDSEKPGPTKPGRHIHVKPGTCTRKDGTWDETRHLCWDIPGLVRKPGTCDNMPFWGCRELPIEATEKNAKGDFVNAGNNGIYTTNKGN